MAYSMFQTYQPFGTLSANSSPISTYSMNSLVPCQRTLSNNSDMSDNAIEHVSEDEYDAMMDNNPLWPSVFATPKGSDLPLGDLAGYSSTLPWASQSVGELQLQRVPSIVSIGPRRDSAGADIRPGSSLSKVWGPEQSPEEQRRQSNSSMVDYNASEPRVRMSTARSVGMGRSSSLLAQAARRRSSAMSSNGSGSLSMSYDPEEAEQVRRIRSMDMLGRRFSEAVYIEPAEPDSPDSESSEEEEERDWTPDLHSKVNIWSPDSSTDLSEDDDDEILSPSIATPEFRPAVTELSNFPLPSFARQAQSLVPSPNLDYIAGDTGRGPVPIRGWQFPIAGRPQPVLPSQYLIPALPTPHAGASLRISSTLNHTSPTVTQSSFKRSASSPLFAARNGDAEAFSRAAGARVKTTRSLRTMVPMAPTASSHGRPPLSRHLSDCKEELSPEAPLETAMMDSSSMLRQGSYAEENRQFEFLAAEITVDPATPPIDYAFPGPPTPRVVPRNSTGISRANAPGGFTLPSFGQGWSSPLLTPGGVTPKYNPMDSFLGKTTATPTLPSTSPSSLSKMPSPCPPKTVATPPMEVEARYKDELVQTQSPSTRMRPRSGDLAVSHTQRHGQNDPPPASPRHRPNSSGAALATAPVAKPTEQYDIPEWRSSWSKPPRLARSVTAPVLGAVDGTSQALDRNVAPMYRAESPVLGHTLSPEPTQHSSRDRKKAHKHSAKCRRCEEKAMMKLLLEQAKKAQEDAASQALNSPRSTTSSSDGRSECTGHHHCGCCSRRDHQKSMAASRPMSAVLLSSEFRHRGKGRDLSGVFPEPPVRSVLAAALEYSAPPPIPAFATGGLPTSPNSPPSRTRVRHARTPSPKRQKQQQREGDLHPFMQISRPVLISTTSNRAEIPAAARGPPMTMELLQGTAALEPPREQRPMNRHSSGSFPQDAGAASSNPNAPAAHSPRPNMRRAVSSGEPDGGAIVSMHGHLAKKPSTSSFFRFLHAGQARHHDPTSPVNSSDSGGRSPKSPEASTSTGIFHRGHRHSASSASSTTTFSAGGRSRPISSSSSGSDRTLVDLKETFKIFAGTAKGRKVMQEDIEEAEFEGAEEVLREERQERQEARGLASKLGSARPHRVGRYPTVL